MLGVAWAAAAPLAAQNPMGRVGSDTIAASGGAVTLVYRTRGPVEATAPAGWAVMSVPGGPDGMVLVRISPQRMAAAGVHPVIARSENLRDTVWVLVPTRRSVAIEPGEVPERLRAGEAYDIRFRVTNSGNRPEDLRLVAMTGRAPSLRVAPDRVHLAPGATQEVVVNGEAGVGGGSGEAVRLLALVPDSADPVAQGVAWVQAIAVSASPEPVTLPLEAGLTVFADASGAAGAVGLPFLRGSGRLPMGRGRYSLDLLPAPANNPWGTRSRYRAGLELPEAHVDLGDQWWSPAPGALLLSGLAGRGGSMQLGGAGAFLRAAAVRGDAYALAGGLGVTAGWVRDGTGGWVGAVRAGDTGFGIANASLARGPWATRIEHVARVSGEGSWGGSLRFQTRPFAASVEARDISQAWSDATSSPPGGRLAASVASYAIPGVMLAAHWSGYNGEFGRGQAWSSSARAEFGHVAYRRSWGQQANGDRVGASAVRVAGDFGSKAVRVRPEAQLEHVTMMGAGSSWWSQALEVVYRTEGRYLSWRVGRHPRRGAEGAELTLSSRATWEVSPNIRLSAAARAVTGGSRSGATVDVGLTLQPQGGRSAELRVRSGGGASDRPDAGYIRVGTPVSLTIAPPPRRPGAWVRVLGQGREPVSLARVQVGNQALLTDERGWARFTLPPGHYPVRVQAGRGQITTGVPATPLAIADGAPLLITVRVMEGAEVIVHAGTRGRPPASLLRQVDHDDDTATPVEGLWVWLTRGQDTIPAVTGSQGDARFPGLEPGRWRVIAGPAGVPAGYALTETEALVDVVPGATERVSFQARPIRRRLVLQRPTTSTTAWHTVGTSGPLRTVAVALYGDGDLWPKLWLANRDRIRNPGNVAAGTLLRVPQKAPLTPEEAELGRRHPPE